MSTSSSRAALPCFWLACVLALAPIAWSGAAEPAPVVGVLESIVDGGRFGPIHVYRPNREAIGVALFFSGDGGWRGDVTDHARRLAGEGYVVGGVDVRNYIATLHPPGAAGARGACVSLALDVTGLSQQLQRVLDLPSYFRPTLFGYSAGASVVYATLAQAPAGLFAGGVSLGFCPEMSFGGATLCAGTGLRTEPLPHAGSDEVAIQPDPKLASPWTVVHGDRDNVCEAAPTRAFMSAIPAAKLIALPGVGHDLHGADNWWPRLRPDYVAMQGKNAQQEHASGSLENLPLVEIPAASSHGNVFAVMISGDGGWAALDQSLTKVLAARGIPVVGINSLKYFWQARNPEQTALDVSRVIEHYAASWRKSRVLLIGYSFGADVMPAVFNRLPAESRARVVSVNLLGLADDAIFQITAAEWWPGARKKGVTVLPEIEKSGSTPMLCIEGAGEKKTFCPDLTKLGVEVRQIGTGHHFSGLTDEIADAILALARGAGGARP